MASAEGSLERPSMRDLFTNAMSNAACTVSVVTTDGPAGRLGVTVSAMTSVSADTPRPTLLVCVHQMSPCAEAIMQNGVFCVNVLRDDQWSISDCFAGRYRTADGNKFSCTEWAIAPGTASRRKAYWQAMADTAVIAAVPQLAGILVSEGFEAAPAGTNVRLSSTRAPSKFPSAV